MTILFLCSSLEPGRDGVGDYTRRLSGELIRQGHTASIIALNDRHLLNGIQEISQSDQNISVPTMRLPASMSWRQRIEQAEIFIEFKNPEWLSLQFVPYSFQDKGLPFGLSKRLKQLGKNRKWHIMFHELWIGMATQSSMKDKLIGLAQKKIIWGLIRSVSPNVIHTSTSLYQSQLRAITRIDINKLPLFGNVPFKNVSIEKDQTTFKFVIFGNIHKCDKLKAFVKWLEQQQATMKNVIELHFVGRNGEELEKWKKSLNLGSIKYIEHGFQEPAQINNILKSADLGLTTTPLLLVEKSGAVAAMMECRLPILCVASDWTVPIKVDMNLPIFEWNIQLNLKNIVVADVVIDNDLPNVTRTFVTSL